MINTNEDLSKYANIALREIGEDAVADKLVIRWNTRMRSAAGRANLTEWTVEMNPKLIAFGEDEVVTTIRHELAHLVAWRRDRHRGHGEPWRQACADLGIPHESVTHSLPLPRRQQRRNYRYSCTKCEYSFDRVRKVKRQSACAKCCREYNGGKFSKKYLLTEQAIDHSA